MIKPRHLLFVMLATYGSHALADEAPLVTGIGGFFFKSEDPGSLAVWYEQHLGIKRVPTSYEEGPWQQEAGYTVFAPFPAETQHFGNAAKQWMLNLRVRDIDLLVARLRASDIEVTDPETYPNGRFARLVDPEGNPIELWQPIEPSGQALE